MTDPRRETLDRLLTCDDSRDLQKRRACFSDLVRLLNDWSGSGGSAAFAHAEQQLRTWPPAYRSVSSELVVHGGRARPTLRLASEVVDAYPDDTARDNATPSRVVFGSLDAAQLDTFVARKASVSMVALAQGPGAARLSALALHDSLDAPVPWKDTAAWPGWTTLQVLAITNSPRAVDAALWERLGGAPAMHELNLSGSVFSDVAELLRSDPRVAHRLDALTLSHCFLRDDFLDALVATPALDALIRLDLRSNSDFSPEAVARLRAAPQFARTTVLVDPPRPPMR